MLKTDIDATVEIIRKALVERSVDLTDKIEISVNRDGITVNVEAARWVLEQRLKLEGGELAKAASMLLCQIIAGVVSSFPEEDWETAITAITEHAAHLAIVAMKDQSPGAQIDVVKVDVGDA